MCEHRACKQRTKKKLHIHKTNKSQKKMVCGERERDEEGWGDGRETIEISSRSWTLNSPATRNNITSIFSLPAHIRGCCCWRFAVAAVMRAYMRCIRDQDHGVCVCVHCTWCVACVFDCDCGCGCVATTVAHGNSKIECPFKTERWKEKTKWILKQTIVSIHRITHIIIVVTCTPSSSPFMVCNELILMHVLHT